VGSSYRIHVLDASGATVALIGDASGAGFLSSPYGVDIGPDGLLYIIALYLFPYLMMG